MRLIISALAVATVGVASANLGNGLNIVNGPGGMTNGGDRSFLETTPVEGTFGYGAQTTSNNVVADDFTVGSGGFIVQSLCFIMYQTGATAPTINGLSWAIDVNPTTTLTASTPTVSWYNPGAAAGVFRVTNTDTTSTNRRIQLIEVDVPDFTLAAGTYWLSWNAAGTLASGPWQPHIPTSMAANGQNARQSIANAAFNQVFVDTASTTGADLPFLVKGQAVPEPASMAALGLGALALIRRRKASK